MPTGEGGAQCAAVNGEVGTEPPPSQAGLLSPLPGPYVTLTITECRGTARRGARSAGPAGHRGGARERTGAFRPKATAGEPGRAAAAGRAPESPSGPRGRTALPPRE